MTEAPETIERVAIVANPSVDDGYSERLVSILGERGVEIERQTEPTGDRASAVGLSSRSWTWMGTSTWSLCSAGMERCSGPHGCIRERCCSG